MKLLLAGENEGKLREFRQLLSGLPLCLVSAAELGLHLHIEETGARFAENAAFKARAYAAASGLPALADDSGLVVGALAGRPGVLSARYAGEGASDADRRRKLLEEMHDVPDGRRGARFCCVVALVWGGKLLTTEGTLEGEIAREERGSGGFGYDSVFSPAGSGRTLSELPPEEKNAISHRGRAGRAMRALIEELLAAPTGPLSGPCTDAGVAVGTEPAAND